MSLGQIDNSFMDFLKLDSLQKKLNYALQKVDYQDREDVKQEVLLKILKAARRRPHLLNDDMQELVAYSQHIIQGTIADYYKARNNKPNVKYFAYYERRQDTDLGSPTEFFILPMREYGYDLSEIRMDYLRHRRKFTKNDRKVLDFLLFDPLGPDLNKSELAEKVKVHKSSVTRAVQNFREKIYSSDEEYADYCTS